MARKKLDYLEIYVFLGNHSTEEAAEQFGVTVKAVAMVKRIGDALLFERPKPQNAKPIDKFSPRELMEELARRGYKGKLQFTQEVDITNF